MSFRKPQHPGEVRTVMEASYARYAMGLDMFPAARLRSNPSDLPRKSKAIARTLASAWVRIDEDESYFMDTTIGLIKRAHEKIRAGELDGGAMLAITQVGRNCVKMATVTPSVDQPQVTLGVFPREEFVREFEGFEFNASGGRTLSLVNGQLQTEGGGPDVMVVRGSNVSGLFLPGSNQEAS